MKILVLYRSPYLEVRKAHADNYYSFKKYDKEDTFYYFNIMLGRYPESYRFIKDGMFDAVIFHNTALILRGNRKYWDLFMENILPVFKNSGCVKVALVQDDYTATGCLWRLFRDLNMDLVYSVLRKENLPLVYPQKQTGNIPVKTVLTGYVDEKAVHKISRRPHCERTLDIVYRAKKLPYSYGRLGYSKYAIIERIEKALADYPNIKADIKATTVTDHVISGDAWLSFLQSSRTVLGTLSGASIMDKEGELTKKTVHYCNLHPDATFEQARQHCFPDAEENIMGMLAPRHFEAAMTRTCQVLLGYDYQGIMLPDVDYIPIREDYSNLSEVLDKIQDVSYCEKTAERCYEHLVASGRYTYRLFVDEVIADIRRIYEKKAVGQKRKKYLLDGLYAYCACYKNNSTIIKELKNKEGKKG